VPEEADLSQDLHNVDDGTECCRLLMTRMIDACMVGLGALCVQKAMGLAKINV
jgi:hypothetical protein